MVVTTLRVELPEAEKNTVTGLRERVGPLTMEGTAAAERVTFPANPFTPANSMMVELDEPACKLRL